MKPLPSPSAALTAHTLDVQAASHGVYRALGYVGAHPWLFVSATAAMAAGLTFTLLARRRKRPSAEEAERLRREHLATHGRIVAGTLLEEEDAEAVNAPPTTLFYRYRIGGVEYSCAQDLSSLPISMEHLRLDLPVQIRYDSRNPGDSIVAAEHWNGLCL